MRSTERGVSEGGVSGRGGWGRRENTTGWVEVGKGTVGRVKGAERLVLRRGECLRGEDGIGAQVEKILSLTWI